MLKQRLNKIRVGVRFTALVIVAFSLLVSPVAAELDPEPGDQSDDIPLVTEEREKKLDDTYQRASEIMLSAADWIDSFFDDERYVLEENKTRARLRLSLGHTRYDHFDTVPSHKMTDLQVSVRYRQRFYRDWLVVEIAPQIGFPESYNRKPNPGIVLRVEADFGYLADQDSFKAVFGF